MQILYCNHYAGKGSAVVTTNKQHLYGKYISLSVYLSHIKYQRNMAAVQIGGNKVLNPLFCSSYIRNSKTHQESFSYFSFKHSGIFGKSLLHQKFAVSELVVKLEHSTCVLIASRLDFYLGKD